jgi:ABC-type multidrug transport system ATPase subunit
MTPDPSPSAIQAQGLAKRFDKVQAVSAVDFKVRSGELFGFLGPNGAGKTTTINMLTGLARPDILFLDEPTTGIGEAERLCDRIAFIVSGRTIRTDTVDNLIQPVRDTHVLQVTCTGRTKDLADTLDRTFPDLAFAFPEQGMIRVTSGSPVRVGPLVRFLEDRAVEVTEAKKIRPSLEEVFIDITGIKAEIMGREKEKTGGGSR